MSDKSRSMIEIGVVLLGKYKQRNTIGHITKNLIVEPWTKTVKKTMARAVVRKSSLYLISIFKIKHSKLKIEIEYHILSSSTTASEKPTAPLG